MPRSAFRLAAAAACAALAGAALAARPARAQGPAGPAERPLGPGTRGGEPRFMGGAAFAVARPVHEFRAAVPNSGLGGAGHVLLRDASGVLALRADAQFVRYGRERLRVPVVSGIGRVTADLVTTNNIVTAGVGPQLMAPSGLVRPYVNASVGFVGFTTTSSLNDRNGTGDPGDDDPVFSETNQQDWKLAGAGGGGLLVRLTRPGSRSVAFLDLSARYQRNGRLRYLTKGGIRDNSDGSVTLDVRESQANFWSYQIGVSLGGR